MFYRGAKQYIMQQRGQIGLFTSSVSSMSRRQVFYTPHETKDQFHRHIKSPFCLCKRGGIERKALEKKNFGKIIFEKKNKKKKYCKNIVAISMNSGENIYFVHFLTN